MRRAKGEGHIRQRKDGRWEAVVHLTSATGATDRRSIYGKGQAEVARRKTELLKAHNDGLPAPSDSLTVRAFFEQWLAAKEANLRPESYRRYRDLVTLHLIPELGRHSLKRLSPLDVEAGLGRLRAKGLSGTTVRMAHGVLHTALASAARSGHVLRNVADLVDVPRKSTPQMDTLTADEARALLAAAAGDPLEAFYTLALTTGMRLGELQALRWRHVDLERATVRVIATYQGNVNGEPVFAEPKTEKSRRVVRLGQVAIEALRRHRAAQLERRLLAGPAWTDADLVFTSSLGRPLDGNNLRTRSFARLLKRAGLPPRRFHSLRHGVATLLMAEGVSIKAISEMLGHSDVSTTLRIYAHTLPAAHEQAAQAMDRLIGQRVGQKA